MSNPLKRSLVLSILTLTFLGATDTTAQNGGPFNYGRQWNGWSPLSRSIYVLGFQSGQSRTYFAVRPDLPPSRLEPLRLETFTLFDGDAVSNVMASLYSDPANTYVQDDDMIYIARDKLSGKDIEPMLWSARARGGSAR
jgi:hypothetical protein